MKKKIFAVMMVLICLAIAATGTLAYFTSEETAHNIITTGAVDIDLEEWQDLDGDGQNYTPYPPEDQPINVMPGVTVSKIATIKSLEADAYIRAKFDVVIKRADKSVMEVSPEELEKVISLTMGSDNWIRKEGDNTWWYYKDAIAGGASTEAFFTEVVFDGPNMTNVYQNCTAEVIVTAQGVQKANNGSSVLEAGWPEEQ